MPPAHLPSQLNLSTRDVAKEESKSRLNVEKMNEEQKLLFKSPLHSYVMCYTKEQDPVKQLYNDLNFKAFTAEQRKERAILTVTNDLSIEPNKTMLNLIPGREEVYDRIDNILSEDP
ncbi:hypothetical protein AVEN_234854-1 [Araneus ventricosus]|uniref:Uncharacterized protein n=1 Tax=Araneus ventricosus TaxID=182803 RepID=A0A4Y2IG80_ARAVE|nr:hypothetical protein AVEN_234854-1 [Araneus ventricosus]